MCFLILNLKKKTKNKVKIKFKVYKEGESNKWGLY